MLLAIHFARSGLLGALPNPLLIAEVPSAAARFTNAFSGPRRQPYIWVQGRVCTKDKKKRAGFRGFTELLQ